MGQWIIRVWIALILGLIAVAVHTQAPLVSLNCPPNEGNNAEQSQPRECAPFQVLIVRSLTDLWSGTTRIGTT
jgi:hypothetical protein